MVKCVDAFIEAARNEPRASIQVGYYQLKKQMKASEALDVLVNPDNLIQSLVIVPEGARVAQIVEDDRREDRHQEGQSPRPSQQPAALGLPARPTAIRRATSSRPPTRCRRSRRAVDLLRQMVAKTVAVGAGPRPRAKAEDARLTPEQVLTMASILEYEANRAEDYPKVARVSTTGSTRACRSSSTRRSPTSATQVRRRLHHGRGAGQPDSPYNTYMHAGLPPGPIGSPGEETHQRGAQPVAEGHWFYFVVNCARARPRFAKTYAEHQRNVALFRGTAESSDAC